MNWIEIEIETTTQGVEPVAGLVLMAGIPGLAVDDPNDIKEYLAGPLAARWDYVDENLLQNPERAAVVRAYVADNAQGRRQWDDLQQRLVSLKGSDTDSLYGSLVSRLRNVKEEDWANNWKAYFKPFTVGERLVVKPTWETWDESDAMPMGTAAKARAVLEIDPGSSFGTGQHETTRMCLELLEHYAEPGAAMLDLGCGSGILMIAALLLGVGYAAGVDVDENAVGTTGANLRQNGITPERYALYAGDITAEPELRRMIRSGLADGGYAGDDRTGDGRAGDGYDGEGYADGSRAGYDLVTANIVADVIIGMAPYFSAFMKQAGRLLVSGIIDDRRDEVISRMTRAGYELIEDRESGAWSAMVFGMDEAAEKRNI